MARDLHRRAKRAGNDDYKLLGHWAKNLGFPASLMPATVSWELQWRLHPWYLIAC